MLRERWKPRKNNTVISMYDFIIPPYRIVYNSFVFCVCVLSAVGVLERRVSS